MVVDSVWSRTTDVINTQWQERSSDGGERRRSMPSICGRAEANSARKAAGGASEVGLLDSLHHSTEWHLYDLLLPRRNVVPFRNHGAPTDNGFPSDPSWRGAGCEYTGESLGIRVLCEHGPRAMGNRPPARMGYSAVSPWNSPLHPYLGSCGSCMVPKGGFVRAPQEACSSAELPPTRIRQP